MFMCRHCMKLSKEPREEAGFFYCPECSARLTTPPSGGGAQPEALGARSGPGTFFLPPGFGGSIGFFKESSSTSDGDVIAKMLLSYSKPLDIPGTTYCTVVPIQPHVSREIVQSKKEDLLKRKAKQDFPSVTVRRIGEPSFGGDETLEGRLSIAEDHHHLFVAALFFQVPIWLLLLDSVQEPQMGSWVSCTYVDKF